ncbi:hypothetical protein L2E82_04556 [Cichorium intybus]|uniref:Uncharacterized protein n=1 Tax=Cichorium intybus TaxID=13427 RepID=A0ACB9H7T4_CICIN|nr:hypothetical protein L2E82_04556 [Cichorium intybus]
MVKKVWKIRRLDIHNLGEATRETQKYLKQIKKNTQEKVMENGWRRDNVSFADVVKGSITATVYHEKVAKEEKDTETISLNMWEENGSYSIFTMQKKEDCYSLIVKLWHILKVEARRYKIRIKEMEGRTFEFEKRNEMIQNETADDTLSSDEDLSGEEQSETHLTMKSRSGRTNPSFEKKALNGQKATSETSCGENQLSKSPKENGASPSMSTMGLEGEENKGPLEDTYYKSKQTHQGVCDCEIEKSTKQRNPNGEETRIV